MDLLEAIQSLTEQYQKNGNAVPDHVRISLQQKPESKNRRKDSQGGELKRVAKLIAQKVMYGN